MSSKAAPLPNSSGGNRPDLKRAVSLVMRLMAVPGKSCEESQIAEEIKQHLLEAGAAPADLRHDTANRKTPEPGEVGNLIFQMPGSQPGPRRMLSAHLDTVPICVGAVPNRQGGHVRSKSGGGLGADNRAGCAVLLTAATEILRRRLPHPPLTFCWFVQEEIGLQGSRLVSKSMLGRPKLAFNWDGGAPDKLTVGATGGVRMRIRITGRASHAGGAPERGVSAIAIAAIAIAGLQRRGWHGDVRRRNQHGTSNVGVIRGGAATNVVADEVELLAEARSHNPEFRARIVSEIELAFHTAAGQVKNVDGDSGSVQIESRLDYESFLLDADEPCVEAAERAVRSVGRSPLRAVANGGVDANWTTRHGIPTVTLGCGQRDPHTVKEALDLEDFQAACQIGLILATAQEGP